MDGLDYFLNKEKEDYRYLFQLYYKPLCHLSTHYLDNKDEAKGVVQDVFVKLWEIRHELNLDSNLRNFLRW
jgi:RNA polymerase sigma-70 factor (ECF subfamily)